MGKIATVDGLEMHCHVHHPVGVGCDFCDAKYLPNPRADNVRERAAEMGWKYKNGKDICPDCVQ